jgi:hypothetical protein
VVDAQARAADFTAAARDAFRGAVALAARVAKTKVRNIAGALQRARAG